MGWLTSHSLLGNEQEHGLIHVGSWEDLTFALWKTAKILYGMMQVGNVMGIRLFPNLEVWGSMEICVSWYFRTELAHPKC